MVDEQAIIVFLRQLDRALAAASRGDEHQRRHRLALTQSLVMAVLADPGILIGHCARPPTAWPTSPADCSLEPGRYTGQARRHAGRRWGRRQDRIARTTTVTSSQQSKGSLLGYFADCAACSVAR